MLTNVGDRYWTEAHAECADGGAAVCVQGRAVCPVGEVEGHRGEEEGACLRGGGHQSRHHQAGGKGCKDNVYNTYTHTGVMFLRGRDVHIYKSQMGGWSSYRGDRKLFHKAANVTNVSVADVCLKYSFMAKVRALSRTFPYPASPFGPFGSCASLDPGTWVTPAINNIHYQTPQQFPYHFYGLVGQIPSPSPSCDTARTPCPSKSLPSYCSNEIFGTIHQS